MNKVIIAKPLKINTFLLKSVTGGSNGKKNNKNMNSPSMIPLKTINFIKLPEAVEYLWQGY